MDFFHCNSCFIQPGPPQNRAFWLSSCGHSFCGDCVNTSETKCKICCAECKYVAVNNDMPEGLKLLFSDPIKELKKSLKILLIQNKHCRIYMEEYVPRLENKYMQAKINIESNRSELEKAKKAIENKEAEVQSLRSQITNLKNELEDLRKQYAAMEMQQKQRQVGHCSPSLSSPSSFDSNQECFFTPKSSFNANKFQSSSFNFMNKQQNNSSFVSNLTPSPPIKEKRKLTAMDLLFKNKETHLRSSQCDPRTPRTPRMGTNQSFTMSINVTPPDSVNSDDSQGPFSNLKNMPSPFESKMRHYQRPSNEMNLSQRRNPGTVFNMSSPASYKSKYFPRSSSEMGKKFF